MPLLRGWMYVLYLWLCPGFKSVAAPFHVCVLRQMQRADQLLTSVLLYSFVPLHQKKSVPLYVVCSCPPN